MLTHILLPYFVKGTGQNHYMRVGYAKLCASSLLQNSLKTDRLNVEVEIKKKKNFQAKKIAKIIHTQKLLSWDNTKFSLCNSTLIYNFLFTSKSSLTSRYIKWMACILGNWPHSWCNHLTVNHNSKFWTPYMHKA